MRTGLGRVAAAPRFDLDDGLGERRRKSGGIDDVAERRERLRIERLGEDDAAGR